MTVKVWRQQDAIRNSIQMVARSHFSHKQLHGTNCNVMLDMIMEHGKPWDEYPLYQQRGRAMYKNGDGYWMLDENIPVFADDRVFINQWLVTEE